MAEQRYGLQTVLSIAAGVLIVVVTIAFVTASVGPGDADERRERAEQIQDEREDLREEREDRLEEIRERDDRSSGRGSGS